MRLLIILPTPTAHSLSTGHVFADTHARTHARTVAARTRTSSSSLFITISPGSVWRAASHRYRRRHCCRPPVIGGATVAGRTVKGGATAPRRPAAPTDGSTSISGRPTPVPPVLARLPITFAAYLSRHSAHFANASAPLSSAPNSQSQHQRFSAPQRCRGSHVLRLHISRIPGHRSTVAPPASRGECYVTLHTVTSLVSCPFCSAGSAACPATARRGW